ncbi:MAG: class I mannose-6-phosphate isomerase [Acidobacteria bacterium]|nr:class I mannose-6-phosphate isomerase [Acidobacteriota bacterium]
MPPSPAAAFPLLVKFIFTSDKLSVQVHPSDDYAARVEGCSGKTEMWHVVNAEPGARLAVGFRKDLPPPPRDALVRAIETGEIEQMLNWTEVRAGDTFFVPAGTVHAIGAGLVICEVQQNCDLTYRLYDYNRRGADGRPRELHIDKALDVIQWRTCGGRTSALQYDAAGARECLAACRHFATEKMIIDTPVQFATDGRFQILIGIKGQVSLESNGHRTSLCSGEAAIIPAQAGTFTINPVSGCVLLRAYQPHLRQDILGPLGARGFSQQQLSEVCFDDRRLRTIETVE